MRRRFRARRSPSHSLAARGGWFLSAEFFPPFPEGLRGKAAAGRDAMIMVDEAFRCGDEQVPRGNGQEQQPAKKGSMEGNVVPSIVL